MQFVRTVMPARIWLPLLATRGAFAMPMLAVVLPAAYCVFKIASCCLVLKTLVGILSSASQVTVGRRATEEDLVGQDRVCPICQDTHKRPVVLTCRVRSPHFLPLF